MAVLDSSFLIDLARGVEAAQAALHTLVERQVDLVVPAQAAIEYLVGLEDPVAGLADLEGSYEVRGVQGEHVLEAAVTGQATLGNGTFPGWADLQIGATALLEGEEVVTADPGNFQPQGCRVWDYRNEARHPDEDA